MFLQKEFELHVGNGGDPVATKKERPTSHNAGVRGGEAAHCPDLPTIGGHGADSSQELSVPSQARQKVARVPGLHLPPPLLSLWKKEQQVEQEADKE